MIEPKLTYEDWLDLNRMLKCGDITQIAKLKKVSKSTVARALYGEADRHGIVECALKIIKDRERIETEALQLIKKFNNRIYR